MAESSRRDSFADILTLGFGTSVLMWTLGYAGRLPGIHWPGSLLFPLMILALIAGGFASGRMTDRGWRGGFATGLTASLVNLLVMGSLLADALPNRLFPSALWWIPCFLAVGGGLAAAGAFIGARAGGRRIATDWVHAFAWVTLIATSVLIVVGGLVTSHEAGLAVRDWPTTNGYNMFLYPLSRMTGGIYYDHAHRLFGSFVGLTSLVLALLLSRNEEDRRIRLLGWAAMITVLLQGILGGLRVTGRLSLGGDPAQLRPMPALAVVHGVVGQIFLGLVAAIVVVTSPSWRRAGPPPRRDRASTSLRTWSSVLVGLFLVEIALGSLLRHHSAGPLLHVLVATAVLLSAVGCGIFAWDSAPRGSVTARLGLLLFVGAILQVFLGVAAWSATLVRRGRLVPGAPEVAILTAHQAFGALLFAVCVALMLWVRREEPRRTRR